MSNKLMTASALTALCAVAAMSMQQSHATGQDGMVVVRDAQTGELRAPTPAESKALAATPQAGLQKQAPVQHQVTTGKGGSRQVRLGETGMVYSVVTRGDDGKLSEHCVQGEDAAQAAVDQPTQAKEPRHESE